MKKTELIMGMPVSVEITDDNANNADLEKILNYFKQVDEKFSTYKPGSEISRINRREVGPENFSDEVKEVFKLAEQTKQETKGFFDIQHEGSIDPSGLVKGWAINNAAKILENRGFKNFYVEAGGDIQTAGKNSQGQDWRVGIKSPFDQKQIVKVLHLSGQGIATSGSYIRGHHIYNPLDNKPITEIVSLTVVAPNIYEADRFATAAFAMGKKGINFIESLNGLEGYIIDKDGLATMTSNFEKYISS